MKADEGVFSLDVPEKVCAQCRTSRSFIGVEHVVLTKERVHLISSQNEGALQG